MKQHEILKKYISGLSQGLATSLIVVSKAGTGKTETVIKTLEDLGYQEGRNYRYLSNYITPVELYLALEDINDLQEPKILILDDCEQVLENKKTIGILKSALWQTPDGKRKVYWQSGTYKVKNQKIEFTGRIILLLNEIKKEKAIISALKDRSFFYEFDLKPHEIKSLILERAKEPYLNTSFEQRIRVAEFLVKNGDIFSLRTYPHALNLFLLSPNHWQELTLNILTGSSEN
jgi:hypothetical protein